MGFLWTVSWCEVIGCVRVVLVCGCSLSLCGRVCEVARSAGARMMSEEEEDLYSDDAGSYDEDMGMDAGEVVEPVSPKKRKSKDTSGTRRKRKRKDPNRPKGRLTSYVCFATVMREKLKEENAGLSFGDLN